MPDPGAPKIHRTEPWAINPEGPRTLEDALALAQRWGVLIPSDVRFFVADDYVPEDAHATYFYRSAKRGDFVRWEEFFHDRLGHIPIRVRGWVLERDEAIVAVFAHEVYEIEGLRKLFAESGGVMEASRLYQLIAPEEPGNLHTDAVEHGDKLVDRMRGQP
jgi:hypothetical protein